MGQHDQDKIKEELSKDSLSFDETFKASNNSTKEALEHPRKDAINPEHYKTNSGLEAIEVMEAFSTLEEFRGHLKLTAMKYLMRLGKKDSEYQELGKAIWYTEKLRSTYKDDFVFKGLPND